MPRSFENREQVLPGLGRYKPSTKPAEQADEHQVRDELDKLDTQLTRLEKQAGGELEHKHPLMKRYRELMQTAELIGILKEGEIA